MCRSVYLLMLVISASLPVRAETMREACAKDLQDLPGFMLENDAGGRDRYQERGAAFFDAALAQARAELAGVESDASCEKLLRGYLRNWRFGHLVLNSTDPARKSGQVPAEKPELSFLSTQTVAIRLPSFDPANRDPLIQLLNQNAKRLASTPNWIIDVRGNDGGSDWSYDDLLPWIIGNETVEVADSWLVTPANTEAQRRVCDRGPDDLVCQRFMTAALERMAGRASGTFVTQEDGPKVKFLAPSPHPYPRAQRVAVLVDRGCVSSCEEFLLKLRQSFNVKLIGQRSHGALDYSNLRPHALPSGRRVLRYATSRSERLPDMPVDAAGVMPDIFLPPPQDEAQTRALVSRVQHWLEGGSLAP
ncbi:S41 family peptidase [Niveibacterium terrae]|uniref:S41 family peptidase n=1 Tax=Niveibacterium terrae TaxID=3373598 RepID=UPI003A95D09C